MSFHVDVNSHSVVFIYKSLETAVLSLFFDFFVFPAAGGVCEFWQSLRGGGRQDRPERKFNAIVSTWHAKKRTKPPGWWFWRKTSHTITFLYETLQIWAPGSSSCENSSNRLSGRSFCPENETIHRLKSSSVSLVFIDPGFAFNLSVKQERLTLRGFELCG